MFSRSRNPLLTFLLSCFAWITLKIQINFRFKTVWFCLINFWNFFTIYVFEVKEPIPEIPTELSCFGDLKNLGQLPVQEWLRVTDDCVLWIFTISSLLMFSRSRNPLLTFLLSCPATELDDLENPDQLPVQEVYTDDSVLYIFDIFSLFMFSRSRNPMLTSLLSYHVRVTSKIRVNFRFKGYWWFCLNSLLPTVPQVEHSIQLKLQKKTG